MRARRGHRSALMACRAGTSACMLSYCTHCQLGVARAARPRARKWARAPLLLPCSLWRRVRRLSSPRGPVAFGSYPSNGGKPHRELRERRAQRKRGPGQAFAVGVGVRRCESGDTGGRVLAQSSTFGAARRHKVMAGHACWLVWFLPITQANVPGASRNLSSGVQKSSAYGSDD